ncbi:MAG: tyrosine decarboxylase MfnA [Methanobrevibacter millerae]|uniref:Probable L-tyrosine/L-aspartate decarboxylase n=1 Tax=Methanobrevibacter millerae TaxID=230361 RepID=A0A8T3VJ37_9EURY|nr:tyrosine decarboxylase MfnA [Methanobrevibacter millerae]MBE6504690.1 tyrosine decarboxylase MfnA [Methanobrevibacter millerae]
MNDLPIDEEEILKELDAIQSEDLKYSGGRILGSMCTEAHPFAKKVYTKFLDSNLGDPGLFKGTKATEDKTIQIIGKLLNLDKAYGNIVTGGTEANIMAIRAARNHARNYKGIKDGEIILPRSAHFSFKKAADMMNLKIVEADLDDNYKIDVDSIKKKITDKTVAIVAIAGTTELGLIDPIEEISKIAYENNIFFHVDAAFGGFSIPFLKNIGYEYPEFDFKLDGVSSITVDPHKMGLAPIPAGGIIFRKKEYLEVMAVDSPYLTVKTQSTIVGTRLGASTVATYALLKYFGKSGYSKMARELMENTYFLRDSLKEIGYEVIVEPELNIVAFNHPEKSPEKLSDELEKINGWKVSVANCPKAIRIVLMNHVTKTHLKEFLNDLKSLY